MVHLRYTGWGDDLWQFNTESENFDMSLQLRLGKVHKFGQHNYNIFVTGAYTPDELRQLPPKSLSRLGCMSSIESPLPTVGQGKPIW